MPVRLKRNEIHLWNIHCTNVEAFKISAAKQLSSDEVVRARKFKNTQHGKCWAFVHMAMREILSQYVSQSAKEIEFSFDRYGKPRLTNLSEPLLHFNLSHSGDNALLALSYFSPLGVDIELTSTIPDIDLVVRRFFSAREQHDFWQLPQTQRIDSFYNIWTRKEALIKANGLGLTAPLEAFDVPVKRFSSWTSPVVRAPLDRLGGYLLTHLAPAPGYTGALCLNFCRLKKYDELKLCTFSF